jgi:hypothetical protein
MCNLLNRHLLGHRGGHEIPKDRRMTAKMLQVSQSMMQAAMVGQSLERRLKRDGVCCLQQGRMEI